MTHRQTDDGAPDARALAEVVDAAAELAGSLTQLLAQEKQALIDQAPDTIASLAATKHAAIARLEALEAQRQSLCRQLAGEPAPPRERMHALLGSPAAWDRYCDRMRRCHDANASNGHLVQLRRRHVTRALQVLGGQDGAPAGVYGPNGADTFAPRSQVLGTA